MDDCVPCPVCDHQPRWHGSMIKDAESIGCNLEEHCPNSGAFDFSTDYLPASEAVAEWNAAVQIYNSTKEGK